MFHCCLLAATLCGYNLLAVIQHEYCLLPFIPLVCDFLAASPHDYGLLNIPLCSDLLAVIPCRSDLLAVIPLCYCLLSVIPHGYDMLAGILHGYCLLAIIPLDYCLLAFIPRFVFWSSMGSVVP